MQIVGVSLKSCAGGSCWQISSGYISCSKWCPIVTVPPQHSIIGVLETRSRTSVTQSIVKHWSLTEEMGDPIWANWLDQPTVMWLSECWKWRECRHSGQRCWRAPGSQLFSLYSLAWPAWGERPGTACVGCSLRRFSAELDPPAQTEWAVPVRVGLTWTEMLMFWKAFRRSSSSTPLGMLLRWRVALGG